MDSLFNDYAELLRPHEAPCISVYQPTHRHHPDNEQDRIRFGNLTKVIEEELRRQYSTRQTGPLLEPFRALAEDREFWNRTLDGLAVLSAPGIFRFYRLQRPMKELVVVSDSFHTKPLLRIIQSADRFHVLALNRTEIKLFEGNRDAVDEIPLDARVPRTMAETVGEKSPNARPHAAARATGVGQPSIMQGSGNKSDMVDTDTEQFFRAADRAVLEHHSRPEGLPVILAALPEHHALFRRVSNNPYLLADAIDVHPDALENDSLRDRAWQLVAPRYLQRLQGLVDQFEAGKSRGTAEDDLVRAAEAAAAGRIATVLIDADRHILGRLDKTSGRIEIGDTGDPLMDDLLDDLGEMVLRMNGEVVVVPPDRMPSDTGIAAIYRY